MKKQVFMRNTTRILSLAALTITALSTQANDNLKNLFCNPPESSKAQIWWHFTTNHISKDGMSKDLEAMKDLGINTAHVFIADYCGNLPAENVKTMTPKWLDAMEHAGKEAKRLGISLGMHNCTGWSSSGGPWIKPEDSMKRLTFSRTETSGGKVALKLPQAFANKGFYRDVAVLAMPSTFQIPTKISSDKPLENLSLLANAQNNTPCIIDLENKNISTSITYDYSEPVLAGSVLVRFGNKRLYGTLEISASEDGKTFKTTSKHLLEERINTQAPIVFPIAKTPIKAKSIKFKFGYSRHAASHKEDGKLLELAVSANSAINNINSKNSIGGRHGATFMYSPSKTNATGTSLNKVLDITSCMNPDGNINAELPLGEWTILRIGYTAVGITNAPTLYIGLECDKLSKRGLDAHWPHYMALLQEKFGGQLKYATIDSWEVRGQNWTEGFDKEFKKRRGYDIRKWLPSTFGITIDSIEKSEKFLFDLQCTVAELFAENYFDYFTELCHKNNLLSIFESYGGPFDSIRCSRTADMPASEFWLKNDNLAGRHTASIANFWGKKHSAAEGFTTGDKEDGWWKQHPRWFKTSGDLQWIEGINTLILHSFVHQPFNARPGLALSIHGSHINRHNTWWKDAREWIKYIERSQTLLQYGSTPTDVLVLAGESRPNSRTRTSNHNKELLNSGYLFDYCCTQDIWDSIKVKDGKIVAPSGVRYEVLYLDNEEYPTLKTLKKLRKLLKDGATIVALRPICSPSLSDDSKEYQEIVKELWGETVSMDERQIGKGKLYPLHNPIQALKDKNINAPAKTPKNVKYIARTGKDADIFFLRESSTVQSSGTYKFRVREGYVPQIWNPTNCEIKPLAQWTRNGNIIEAKIELMPMESLFVVFVKQDTPSIAFEKFDTLSKENTDNDTINIISAVYRPKNEKEGKDVSEVLKKLTGAGFVVSNAIFGDPFPNKQKVLDIRYSSGGKFHEATIEESSTYTWKSSEWHTKPTIKPVIENNIPAIAFEKNGTAKGKLSDGTSFDVSEAALPKPIDISTKWVVNFEENLGAPKGDVKFQRLTALNKHSNLGIKYFSGTATYKKSFNIDKSTLAENMRVILSLGEVREIARVRINGKEVALLWKIPYDADITNFVKEGENFVEVDVVNLWFNRIIGDEITSPIKYNEVPKWVLDGKLRPDDNSRFTFIHKFMIKDTKLCPSGLLGDVKIRFKKLVPLKK